MPGDKFTCEVLKLRKGDIAVRVSTLKDFAENMELDVGDITTIKDEVKILQFEINTLRLDIFKNNAAAVTKAGGDQIDIAEFTTFDSDLREILRKCNAVDHQIVQGKQKTAENQAMSLPLGKLDLFMWDGDIGKWNAWFSLFKSTIDSNPGLTSSQKFLYLKKYLTGEPLSICEQFEITDYNYGEAIALLKNRYQNEPRLGSFYLSQLLNYYKKYSGSDLSKYLTVHRSSIAALRNLSEIADLADFCFFHLSYNNLDPKWQNSFDMSRPKGSSIPTVEDLFEFIQFAATNQELKFDSKYELKKEAPKEKFKYTSGKKHQNPFVGINEAKTSRSQAQEKTCPLCSESHKLYLCDKFKGLSADRRNELVAQWRRCTNCLGIFHRTCLSKHTCLVCHKPHHTLLHKDGGSNATDVVSCATSTNKQVLLGTIQCEIKDSFHTFLPVRILLDSGAQTSVVSYDLVKKLGLQFHCSEKSIKGLAENKIKALGQIDLTVRTRNTPKRTLMVSAIVLNRKRLCGNLLARDVPETVKANFQHLDLADPNFIKSSKVDLILGADMLPEILQPGGGNVFKDSTGLIGLKTIFGFVISGAVPELPKEANEVLVSFLSSSLEENMEKFWKTEEVVPPPVSMRSPDDERCERLFTETTRRLPDGRFSVRLPFKPGAIPEKLKNSKWAENSYRQLEKKLSKDETLQRQYKEQILSYIELDQMDRCPFGTASYIMPQLAVVRKSALTTQLRVCFNASSSAYAGPNIPRSSLNDLLMPGPKLQSDLNVILMQFRLNKVALIADVEMMFRRVEVAPADRKFLNIYYRESPDADLEEMELKVLPFGIRCSPYLAQRAVQELLDSDGHYHPEAASALRKCLYVDDFVGSVSSVQEAIAMKNHLSQLMKRGGFVLRKWASSHPEVLKDTPQENKGKLCFDDENRTVKVLGLQWDAIDDCFGYKTLEFASPVTKRNCLSYIARTFDSLGLVSPVIFWMKLFLQKLWTLKIDWDETLPANLCEKWTNFIQDISALEELRIPRCIRKEDAEVFLAGFSDGSQVGYAACIYLVTTYPNGRVTSHLVAAKSKLAPLATISIPRLELNGALLMSQLCSATLRALADLDVRNVYLFTDSQIVLAWIKTPPYQLKTYVANRIAKIQQLTASMHWSYVSSMENPSDYATRGLFPTQLLNNALWWAGPPFLQQDRNSWLPPSNPPALELPELKEVTIMIINESDENDFFSNLTSRCSTLGKLQRVLAYILRFRYNATVARDKRRLGSLHVQELQDALKHCVLLAQKRDLSEDINYIKTNRTPTKRLLKFSPFLDDEGVLRVGGRLGHSLLPHNEKHPILLLKNSILSKLICIHYHQMLLHAGPRTTRAVIQRRFWITSLHSLLRKIIHQCPRCIRWHGKPSIPEMGALPASRVRPSRCFASTTLDMAGPFIVTETRRRKGPQHKMYLCVFVCDSTKAVHLEPVTELTTAAFLAAFHRFSSRRSLPYRLRSDNGRNFIGARRHLKECQQFLQDHHEEIRSSLSSREVQWDFNPAYAPHFGGLHEAAVKSAKLLFHKVVGDAKLTLEEFHTLLARIEAVLNSRPLGILPSEPNEDLDYLSPGHFLVGGPLIAVPEQPVDMELDPRNRWEMVQLSQNFWKRYHREYLHTLLTREKWSKGSSDVAVGQVVYVSGEKTSPLTWPLGKIVGVYPGADGKVRVADIKVNGSVIRRAVHKLIPLPVRPEF